MDLLFPLKNICANGLLDFAEVKTIKAFIMHKSGSFGFYDSFKRDIEDYQSSLPNYEHELKQVMETTTSETIDSYFSELKDNVNLIRDSFDYELMEKTIIEWNKTEIKRFEEEIEKETAEYFAKEERKYKNLEEYETWDFGWFGFDKSSARRIKLINHNFYCIEKTPDLIDTDYIPEYHKLIIDLGNEFVSIANKYADQYFKKKEARIARGEKYLLIIAIDKYTNKHFTPLNNTKKDAQRIIELLLSKYGFKLIQDPLFNEDGNRKNIIEALNSLSLTLSELDSIIIYFAGHGAMHSITKKGYWIPSDASQTISDYIPNSTVIDLVEGILAKHLLLISDSCFSGTFLTQTREANVDRNYVKMAEQKSRWVITSGREETVSDGQPGKGSPFAISLINFLGENTNKNFSITELFVQVANETGRNSKQQPIFSHMENVGHEGGQMVFELEELNKIET